MRRTGSCSGAENGYRCIQDVDKDGASQRQGAGAGVGGQAPASLARQRRQDVCTRDHSACGTLTDGRCVCGINHVCSTSPSGDRLGAEPCTSAYVAQFLATVSAFDPRACSACRCYVYSTATQANLGNVLRKACDDRGGAFFPELNVCHCGGTRTGEAWKYGDCYGGGCSTFTNDMSIQKPDGSRGAVRFTYTGWRATAQGAAAGSCEKPTPRPTAPPGSFGLVKRETGCGNWAALSNKLELPPAGTPFTPAACAAECMKRGWCTHFYVSVAKDVVEGVCSLVPDECTPATYAEHDYYVLEPSKSTAAPAPTPTPTTPAPTTPAPTAAPTPAPRTPERVCNGLCYTNCAVFGSDGVASCAMKKADGDLCGDMVKRSTKYYSYRACGSIPPTTTTATPSTAAPSVGQGACRLTLAIDRGTGFKGLNGRFGDADAAVQVKAANGQKVCETDHVQGTSSPQWNKQCPALTTTQTAFDFILLEKESLGFTCIGFACIKEVWTERVILSTNMSCSSGARAISVAGAGSQCNLIGMACKVFGGTIYARWVPALCVGLAATSVVLLHARRPSHPHCWYRVLIHASCLLCCVVIVMRRRRYCWTCPDVSCGNDQYAAFRRAVLLGPRARYLSFSRSLSFALWVLCGHAASRLHAHGTLQPRMHPPPVAHRPCPRPHTRTHIVAWNPRPHRQFSACCHCRRCCCCTRDLGRAAGSTTPCPLGCDDTYIFISLQKMDNTKRRKLVSFRRTGRGTSYM